MGNSNGTISGVDEFVDTPVFTSNYTSTMTGSRLRGTQLFMILVTSIISLAIFFNFRVIYIVVRALCTRPLKHGASGNQHAFVYVLSLSIVDSFVLAHLPLVATDMATGRWVFGLVVCKLYWTIEMINRILSTFILTALSADRYLAVCHPFNQRLKRLRTTESAIYVIVTSVLVAGLLLIPVYIYSSVDYAEMPDGRLIPKCAFQMDPDEPRRWLSLSNVFLIYIFVGGYCIPLALMIFFYAMIPFTLWRKNTPALGAMAQNAGGGGGGGSSGGTRLQRGQRRAQNVTQRVLVLVLFYFGCWTPYWSVQFYLEFIFDPTTRLTTQDDPLIVTILVVHLLTYLNSAVNPFLYALLNRELQAHSSSSASSLCTHPQRQSRMTGNGEHSALMNKPNRLSPAEKTSRFTEWLVSNRRGSVGQDPNEIPLLPQNGENATGSQNETIFYRRNGEDN